MVCGDVVLLNFADIFILICGIAVLKIFWVISMQFSDVILCSVYTYICAVFALFVSPFYPPPDKRVLKSVTQLSRKKNLSTPEFKELNL